jgi:beta-aspartyl-peptidase (threonine type)
MIFFVLTGFLPAIHVYSQENVLKPPSVESTAVIALESVQKWVLVIHGGAGGPGKGEMPAEKEKAYLEKLGEALKIGSGILSEGGSSLNAVEAVVKFMEDCPLFNAGLGAVLNENGQVELDASIMDGRTGQAGAVACVTTIRNPVSAARLVMGKTKHVMLAGKGAETFAESMKLKPVIPSYFITPERLEAWKKWKAENDREKQENQGKQPDKDGKGTVGAVALDMKGNLAAATSTGGRMGKMAGRVGDSPIIGAGTFANNKTCAVSATGHGEFFIRNAVAYDLSARMEYLGIPLDEAAKVVVMEKLAAQGASGGLIAVDHEGNIAMPFNSGSMLRGYATSNGETETAIF